MVRCCRKPGSITPHTKFEAEVYVLTKDEGGRHTPFFTNYRPQFYFRTTDVTGMVDLPEGVEMVMPGDNVLDEGGADCADRDGRGPALRHPRRRTHRRRAGVVNLDYRVTPSVGVWYRRRLGGFGEGQCSSTGRAPVSKTGGCGFETSATRKLECGLEWPKPPRWPNFCLKGTQ